MPEAFKAMVEPIAPGDENAQMDELGDHSDVWPEPKPEPKPEPEVRSNAPEGFIPIDDSEFGDEPEERPAKGAESRIGELTAARRAAEEKIAKLEAELARREVMAEPLPDDLENMTPAQLRMIADRAAKLAAANMSESGGESRNEALEIAERNARNLAKLSMQQRFTGASERQVEALMDLQEQHNINNDSALLKVAQELQPKLFPKTKRVAPTAMPTGAPSDQAAPAEPSQKDEVMSAYHGLRSARGSRARRQEAIKLMRAKGLA